MLSLCEREKVLISGSVSVATVVSTQLKENLRESRGLLLTRRPMALPPVLPGTGRG